MVKLRNLFRAVLVVLTITGFALADVDAVRDLGCRPNDPSFDNGIVITDAIASHKVNDTLHFPGGTYYCKTPIDFSKLEGQRVAGQGYAAWNEFAGNYLDPRTGKPQRLGNSSVRIVYIGPAEYPAVRISAATVLDGLNIWRGWRLQNIERAGSVGIEVIDHTAGPPAGDLDLRNIGIAGFDIGLYLKRNQSATRPNHCDCSTYFGLRFNSCETNVLCDESQSTTHDFRGVWSLGTGKTIFDWRAGGNLFVSTLGMVESRLLLSAGSNANTCSFEFYNLKIDPNADGWRLYEMQRPGPLKLIVRGHIGQGAMIGNDPIVILKPRPTPNWKPPKDYQVLDVAMYGPNPSDGIYWRPIVEEYVR